MPELLDIDISSAQGMDLLRALARRHGEPIAAAAQQLNRLFLLRAPWAPGLRFAGGIAAMPAPGRAMQSGAGMSCGGGGVSIEDALASCIGEAIERLSQYEHPGDVVLASPLDDAADRVPEPVRRRIEQLLALSGMPRSTTIEWANATCAKSGQQVLLPVDWCYRRKVDGPLKIPGAALSTGVAAGPSFVIAATRAMLELIERDAASLWWIGGRRAATPTLDSPATTEAADLLTALRQGSRERSSWLLDLTTDLGVPVIAAISTNRDGDGFACGLAARVNAQAAARAAVLEMCQMEIALNIAEGKAARGTERLNQADTDVLRRARELSSATCALLLPVGVSRPPDVHPGDMIPASLTALAERIDVYLVDITRAEFAIPVVAAVAPELQLLPAELETDRLRRAIVAAGGGQRYTRNHSLV